MAKKSAIDKNKKKIIKSKLHEEKRKTLYKFIKTTSPNSIARTRI